jgi:hypothetical protein
LHRNDFDKYLCPVRSFLDWKYHRGVTPGMFFTKVDKHERVYDQDSLLYPAFKDRFERDLQDIGYAKWYLYGTHSFQRGGCQYWCHYANPKWDIRQLCLWGGWSVEFDSMTIVRYMIGANDVNSNSTDLLTKPQKRKAID